MEGLMYVIRKNGRRLDLKLGDMVLRIIWENDKTNKMVKNRAQKKNNIYSITLLYGK